MNIYAISSRQFNAFCYIREPHAHAFFHEVAWLSSDDKMLLGLIVCDHDDGEHSFLVLSRDERKVFQGQMLAKQWFRTKKRAVEECKLAMRAYVPEPVGETIKKGQKKIKPNEILAPLVPKEKWHPYFQLLMEAEGYGAAKKLISEIVFSYVDVDGHFIREFQTTAFDARLWELFLYVYLHSSRFVIDRTHHAPDYLVSRYGKPFAIEAVTVNSSEKFDEPFPTTQAEIWRLSRDYMPIKFGSTLTSKLQKKYWEKAHVKGKPFILAVHDYHMKATDKHFGSMMWSSQSLCDYLYGQRVKSSLTDEGQVIIETEDTVDGVVPVTEKITEHCWKEKNIPSGFFFLPDAAHVSAVLYGNHATMATFNRMGHLAGFSPERVYMVRHSYVHDNDPFSKTPLFRSQNIDEQSYEENWGDGLIMYHNPDAFHPVDRASFPGIMHMYQDKKSGALYTVSFENHIFSSATEIFVGYGGNHAILL